MYTSLLTLLLALSAAAAAATIRVDVGEGGAFTFSPDTIKAGAGDTLDFHFYPLNHSVVMGDFSNPCAPAKTGGFFSGFMPVSSGEAVRPICMWCFTYVRGADLTGRPTRSK